MEKNQIIADIRIIAGYAGIGKTTLAKQNPERFIDFVIMPYKYYLEHNDKSDESVKANTDNVMREDFPYNYFEAIKKEINERDKILLIPSDSRVLRLLREENIPYILCYPVREAKEVYYRRYINRGNTEDFINIFINLWNDFMDLLENDQYGYHVIMEEGQFLSDVMEKGIV